MIRSPFPNPQATKSHRSLWHGCSTLISYVRSILSRAGKLWAWLITISLIFGLYGTLVTYGTWSFFAKELRGEVYDSLAASLLYGSAEVAPSAIDWEGIKIGEKWFTYFGLFPALLRIPLNAAFPDLYGLWSRLSCFIAGILCVAAVILSCRRSAHASQRVLPSLTLVVAVTLCSPLVYLVSCARIYHEAIIWGLAWSMLAIPALLKLTLSCRESTWALGWLSICAAAALHARITFGLPLYFAFSVLLIRATSQGGRSGRVSPRVGVALIMPAFIGGLGQFWYNWARFGSILETFDYKTFYLNPNSMGGEFNLRRILETVPWYFGVSSDNFSVIPPFLLPTFPEYSHPELFVEWKEPVFPLTLSSLPLILLALSGLIAVVRRRNWLALLVAAGFTGQAILICSFFFVTTRYAAEFLPLLVYLSAFGVSGNAKIPSLSFVLVPPFAAATLASTLSWHLFFATPTVDIPRDWQNQLQSLVLPTIQAPQDPAGTTPYAVSLLPNVTPLSAPDNVRMNLSHDGNPLSLFGRQYQVGIGLRFDGGIIIDLPPNAQELSGIVALPDQAHSCVKRRAVLQIALTDGSVLHESPLIEGFFPPYTISIRIPRGERTVSIALKDRDGRPDCDYINLLDLHVFVPASTAVSHETPQESSAPMTISPVVHPLPGKCPLVRADKLNTDTPIHFDGAVESSGLSIHAPCIAHLPLPAHSEIFQARLGIADTHKHCPLTDFHVLFAGDDGQVLFGPFQLIHGSPSFDLKYSVRGVRALRILAAPGYSPDCDVFSMVRMRVSTSSVDNESPT